MKIQIMPRLLTALALVLLLIPCGIGASQTSEAKFDRSRIEITILATPHLLTHDFNKMPIDTGTVRRRMAQFKPDHVVVEWLHPSIDPQTPGLYYSFADFETLKRLWGYREKDAKAELGKLQEALALLKSQGIPTAEARVELGKLYYLNRDVLNAGYQWWIAKKSGAIVRDLQRLTRNNFEGHELELFGFTIAYEQGLDYLTPFDYQGADADWGAVEQKIVSRVCAIAIQVKHGITENDPRWKPLAEEFLNLARAYNDDGDPAFKKAYGGIKEVDEASAALIENRRESSAFGRKFYGAEPLALMRYHASKEFIARERRTYYEIIAGISVDGLGERLVRNYELRNRKMLDYIEQDIPRLKSKRILIIVGAGHRMFLEDQLHARGYKVVSALDFLQ